MPDTPLNPDALEAAYIAVSDESWLGSTAARSIAKAAVTAYLAVSQPEVNSVEELDALPYGSFIVGDSGVAVLKFDGPNYDWVTGSDARYRMDEQMNDLPARVLYRPTEETPNA